MATLKPLSGCAFPAIHGCKDLAQKQKQKQKHNGNMVRVCGALSSPHQNSGRESPFQRNFLSGWMVEPSLIEKTETAIRDYCSTLEGDEGYNCWQGYFEFKKMKKEDMAEAGSATANPLERLEKLVRQSGSVESLIEIVHNRSKLSKMHEGTEIPEKSVVASSNKNSNSTRTEEKIRPDGVPKSQQELEEEEKDKAVAFLPESSHTRLLRSMHIFPAWYTPRPDHETD